MFNGGFIKRDYSTANLRSNNNMAPSIPLYHRNNLYSNNNLNSLPPIYKENTNRNFKDDLYDLEKQIAGYNKMNINNYFPKVPLSGYSLEDTNQFLQKGKQIQQYEKYLDNLLEKKEIMNNLNSKIKLLVNNPLEEEFKKLKEAENPKEWNSNLEKEANEMNNDIKSQLNVESKQKSNNKPIENKEQNIDNINRSLIDLKKELSSQLIEFDKSSEKTFEDIKTSLAESDEKKLEYLVNKIFPSTSHQVIILPRESKSDLQIQRKLRNEYQREQNQGNNHHIQINNNLNNSIQPQQTTAFSLSNSNSNSNNKNEIINQIPHSLKRNIRIIPQHNQEIDYKPSINYDELVYNLDLRERYLNRQKRTHKEVSKRLKICLRSDIKMSPINKFRSYVYFMIAAKRILNIQYIMYSRFKFNSMHYFINNYEDMDIIISKTMHKSIRPVISELITNNNLDINISYEKSNSHSLFLIFKEILELIVNGLTKEFAKGVSRSMLTYLSLFISNYSYIPSAFYTTFELVRIRTTSTGELIGLERQQQIMILGFYLFFKILLKSIMLELSFNPESIPSLSRQCKLNIKMIVSIIYRGLMDEFKKCPRQRHVYDIELKNESSNYREICYVKKEVDIGYKVRRKKKNMPTSLHDLRNKDNMDRNLYKAYKQGLNDEGRDNLDDLPLLRKIMSRSKSKRKRLKRSVSLPGADSQQSKSPKTNETMIRKDNNSKRRKKEEQFIDWMNEDEKGNRNDSYRKKRSKENKDIEKKTKRGQDKNEGMMKMEEIDNDNKLNNRRNNFKSRSKSKKHRNKEDPQQERNQIEEDINDQGVDNDLKKKTSKKRGKKKRDENDNNQKDNNEMNEEIDNKECNKSQNINSKKEKKKRSSSKTKHEAPRMPPPNSEVRPPEHPRRTKPKRKKSKFGPKSKIQQNESYQDEGKQEEGDNEKKKRKSKSKHQKRQQIQEDDQLIQIEENEAKEINNIPQKLKPKKAKQLDHINQDKEEKTGKVYNKQSPKRLKRREDINDSERKRRRQRDELENNLNELTNIKPKKTRKPININQIEDTPINSHSRHHNKNKELNISKSHSNIHPCHQNHHPKFRERESDKNEAQSLHYSTIILPNENNWSYKYPVFPPEFTQEEIKAIKYIFKELPQYGDDSDQNEFELIDRIVYQKDKLKIYELYRDEYGFDPITPLMMFLEDLLDLILQHFNQVN